MKKFTKLSLLAIVWLSCLWLSYAQNWSDPNPEYLVSEANISEANRCMCGTPMIEVIDLAFLIFIWLILLILTISIKYLWQKFKSVKWNTKLFNIPILNIYQLFNNTIWKAWLYIFIFCILFLFYGIYINRDGCCHYSTLMKYCIVTAWTIWLLILSWLSYKFARNLWRNIAVSILFAIALPFWLPLLLLLSWL